MQLNEISILTKAHHPNVTRILGVYEDSNNYCIVQEFMVGGDLGKHIRLEQRLSEKQVARVITQVLRALQYLHHRNIVHRDLKQANILLDRVISNKE